MSLDMSDDFCKMIRTGKPNHRTIRLPPDYISKLSKAELLDFLNNNEKEIIDGVIDTLNRCGIEIKINKNKNEVIFESPGYYTLTHNVKTGKHTKTYPVGFGSSKPRFLGGKQNTDRNITKKNRKNLKHFKKNIHGMVMNGGDINIGYIIIKICDALANIYVGVLGITLSPLFLIVWASVKIYDFFNKNPSTVVVTNTDDVNDVNPRAIPQADLGYVHDNAIYAEAEGFTDEVPEGIAKVVPEGFTDEVPEGFTDEVPEGITNLVNVPSASPFNTRMSFGGRKSRRIMTRKQKRRRTKK
jgi:hypothetical protein